MYKKLIKQFHFCCQRISKFSKIKTPYRYGFILYRSRICRSSILLQRINLAPPPCSRVFSSSIVFWWRNTTSYRNGNGQFYYKRDSIEKQANSSRSPTPCALIMSKIVSLRKKIILNNPAQHVRLQVLSQSQLHVNHSIDLLPPFPYMICFVHLNSKCFIA